MEVTEPTDEMTNGTVRVELEISDPVTDLGIRTSLLDIDIEGTAVTRELADHINDELMIDVTNHGAELYE